MKKEFEQFEELRRTYPKTMSKDQFYKAAHISKATALYLLQSGLVPCKDSGKATHRYTIKTKDVIAYLQDRILYPSKYTAPDGWYTGRSRGKVKKIESGVNQFIRLTDAQKEKLKKYFADEMSELEDLISTSVFAEFLGYDIQTVLRWCNQNRIHYFTVGSKFSSPKSRLLSI